MYSTYPSPAITDETEEEPKRTPSLRYDVLYVRDRGPSETRALGIPRDRAAGSRPLTVEKSEKGKAPPMWAGRPYYGRFLVLPASAVISS